MRVSQAIGAALAAILISGTLATSNPAQAENCDRGDRTWEQCTSASTGDGAVTLRGDHDSTSTDDEGAAGDDRSDVGTRFGTPASKYPPGTTIIRDGYGNITSVREPFTVRCDPPACGTVHMSDLVSFRPTTPNAGSEPRGWAVIGLPTNFFAEDEQAMQSGTLLGQAAEVRFIGARYAWSYGDGSTRTADTAGARWAQLHLAEFSDTDASHVYTEKGTVTVSLTVSYAAEYRINGGPWRTVLGTVDATAPPLTMLTVHAKTVLVAHDCLDDPHGPGC